MDIKMWILHGKAASQVANVAHRWDSPSMAYTESQRWLKHVVTCGILQTRRTMSPKKQQHMRTFDEESDQSSTFGAPGMETEKPMLPMVR